MAVQVVMGLPVVVVMVGKLGVKPQQCGCRQGNNSGIMDTAILIGFLVYPRPLHDLFST